MPKDNVGYRSALRFAWLTRHYDWILDLTMKDRRFKQELIKTSNLQPNHRVLDFGCGTGTLTLLSKQVVPEAEVIGVDVDAQILRLAERRSTDASAMIEWIHGRLSDTFDRIAPVDRVLSSLVFHHLTTPEKKEAMSHLYRLLRPGGEIHIADIGRGHTMLMRLLQWPIRMFDGFDRTEANVRGEMPILLRESGFVDVYTSHRFSTICGTITLLHGKRPA